MNVLKIWTDGSCINNGSTEASCGIGVFYSIESKRNVSTKLPMGKQTNNRAELCAILYALCTNMQSDDILILTDSNYSIKCITEYKFKWQLNGWKTAQGKSVEWSNIIRYISQLIESRLEQGKNTHFEHIKGHSGDIGNTHADQLAHSAALNGTISNTVIFLNERCDVPFS